MIPSFRRSRLISGFAALILCLGVAVVSTVATAGSAAAANGPCVDWAQAQPTPVHSYASANAPTAKFLNENAEVTGTCHYFYDVDGGPDWFMQVNYTGPGNTDGYGYIWVQRLQWGSSHQCYDTNAYPFAQKIGSSYCPL
jgi:hypothetical protein